jgi:mannose-6-phosphate isomerase-like protein (cupin superfamily)
MTHTSATGLTVALALGLPAAAAAQQPIYFPADRTAAGFAKGQPLIENEHYKVHTSRREAPGQAEVHDADTDIFYILEGAATIVTGGRPVAAKQTAPGEHRADAIEGGTPQRLVKGDVFIVPSGVPHQFTEVKGPLLYYTVKVTGAAQPGR